MDTFEAINSRRSIKNFDKTHKMTKNEIMKLLEFAILSPTSYNIQNWRFYVTGSLPSSDETIPFQPMITIVAQGAAGQGVSTSQFNLETTITQRAVNQ